MSKEKINCAIYPRKSKQIDDSDSMDAQIFMCKDFLDKKYGDGNYTLEIFDGDYGITGHEVKKRKDFQRMMDKVKAGKIKLVLVQRYDRIARNTRDFCNLYYDMEKAGCDLVSVSQQIDTSTPYGRKFMYDQASMAELEWALCSERRKDVNKYARLTGRCNIPTRLMPIGYKREVIDGVGRMVINEEEVEIVKFIFDEFEKTSNMSKVTRECNERWNFVKMTNAKMRKILHNEKYIGKGRDNDHFCPPLISEEQFNRLQVKRSPIEQRAKYSEVFFTGLLLCPYCGRRMNSQAKTKSSKNNVYRYYICQWTHQRQCDNHRCLSQNLLEQMVINYIKAEFEPYNSIEVDTKTKQEEVKVIDISRYQAQLDRLNNLYIKGRLSEELYESQYVEIKKIIDENKNLPKTSVEEAKVRTFSSGWEELYNSLDDLHKKMFWKANVRCVEFDKEFNIANIEYL